MLGKAFLEVTALHVMKTSCVPTVVARINTAVRIEFDAKRIAATLREDFIFPLLRVVTPNQLADRMNWLVFAAITFYAS